MKSFWSKVEKTDTCWNWTASCHPKGYGQFGFRKTIMRASRVAWILTFGEIPDGQCVLHKCDNRKCVRPDHLFLGTPKDNTKDMLSKSREARGSRNGMTNLSEDQVIQIRERYAQGGITQQALADEYGSSQARISFIVNRKNWTHV